MSNSGSVSEKQAEVGPGVDRFTLSACLDAGFVVMGSLVIWLGTVKPGPQAVWGTLIEGETKLSGLSGERCPVYKCVGDITMRSH